MISKNDIKEIWVMLDFGEKVTSIVQLILFVLFTYWLWTLHFSVPFIVYGSIALFFYIMHQRDVYYVFGSCVALKDATFTVPKHGGLHVDSNGGRWREYYMEPVGSDVVKLLKKNGYEVITDGV